MWLLKQMPRVATLLLLRRKARWSHQALCCSRAQVRYRFRMLQSRAYARMDVCVLWL